MQRLGPYLVSLGKAFERMREAHRPSFPPTVYYAFKQAESEENGDEEAITRT